jgi:hypothetical protein
VPPLVCLVRRWAVDWLASADPEICNEILAPGYRIVIGGYTLGPRDAYIAATVEQLKRFPGLGLTIHELIWSGDSLAVRFTEHGASVKLDGRQAAWGGVALFRSDGRRLTECFAEEDYFSRRRQLSEGRCDPIEPPAPAPWNTRAGVADPAAEAAVRDWLQRGSLSDVELDDGWTGQEAGLLLEDPVFECNELFSAGDRVAFHGRQLGHYAGGLDKAGGRAGAEASHHLAGIVRVIGGQVSSGRVVRDRLGLQRALGLATP